MDQQPRNEPHPEPESSSGNTGRPSPREPLRPEPLVPEVLEPGEEQYEPGPGGGMPFGGGPGGMFEPRSFGGGRVQVFGCSPGCLILSLVVSVVLSVVLTLLLNLIF